MEKLRVCELPGDRRIKPINYFLLYVQLISKSIDELRWSKSEADHLSACNLEEKTRWDLHLGYVEALNQCHLAAISLCSVLPINQFPLQNSRIPVTVPVVSDMQFCTALRMSSIIGPEKKLSRRRIRALCPLMLASPQLQYVRPIVYKIFLPSRLIIQLLCGHHQVRHAERVPQFPNHPRLHGYTEPSIKSTEMWRRAV
jgi:hypothetical protein